MSSLAELQAGFARALRDPAAPAPDGLRGGSRSGATRRFDVYRNNMVAGLADALQSTFPAVRRLVGEEYFAAVAREYVLHHPPDSPVLLEYGERFGDFLEAFPSASGVPYLGDVARLEWARIKALHAADVRSVSIEALAGVDPERLGSVTVALHPSLSLVRSRWPVVSLWSACVDAGRSDEVDMDAAEHAVVVRPALRVAVHRLPAGETELLAVLAQGAGLGAAAQRAMDSAEAFDLSTGLQRVFEIGAVSAVNVVEKQDQS